MVKGKLVQNERGEVKILRGKYLKWRNKDAKKEGVI